MPKRPPSDERLQRIKAKLEQRRRRNAAPASPIFEMLPHELPREAAARARASGRTDGLLIVPKQPETPEEIAAWEAASVKWHEWSLKQTSRLAEGGLLLHASRIEQAYLASLDPDAPMPD